MAGVFSIPVLVVLVRDGRLQRHDRQAAEQVVAR
jgi:hypothetical protein